jgi:hypothetical protein
VVSLNVIERETDILYLGTGDLEVRRNVLNLELLVSRDNSKICGPAISIFSRADNEKCFRVLSFLFLVLGMFYLYLPTAPIAIRIASTSTSINAAATKCATRAIATRSTGRASRLIIAISPAISIAASRASIVILALVIIAAAFTRSLTAFATVTRSPPTANVGSASRTLLLTSYDVVLVNTLSTEYVTTYIEDLWEDTLADSGFTELALEADLIQLEVVPYIGLWREGVNQLRLLSVKALPSLTFMEGPSSEGRCYICSFWCSQFLGCRSRQWLSPVEREVCFGRHSTLGISSSHLSWYRFEESHL